MAKKVYSAGGKADFDLVQDEYKYSIDTMLKRFVKNPDTKGKWPIVMVWFYLSSHLNIRMLV